MARGEKLFLGFVVNDKAKEGEIVSDGVRKGRNATLFDRRNECLFDRYFYYTHNTYKNFRYDLVLEKLSDEFFITPRTLADILQENSARLKELKKKPATKQQLQTKWPQYSWQ